MSKHYSTLLSALIITLLATSCSKLFNRNRSNAPTITVENYNSDNEEEEVVLDDIEGLEGLIIIPNVDTVGYDLSNYYPIEGIDSLAVAAEQIDSLDSEYPHFDAFTSEQSSGMHIDEYENTTIEDTTIALATQGGHYPTDGGRYVTSPYGWRRSRMHSGTDIKVLTGENIYSVFDGVVRLAKYYGSYGYCIIVRHYNGLETLYGHCSKLLVDVNTEVKAGDKIALGGNTGRSTGSHLHFETRIQGKYFDPSTILDNKEFKIKDATLYLQERNKRLFASNNDSQEERDAYILSQISIRYHIVRSGDTLSGIAKRNGTTVTTICRLNGISSRSILRIGQRLIVRDGIRPKSTTTTKATTAATTTKSTKTTTSSKSQSASNSTPLYHTIKSGDTLSKIAANYHTTITKICALNNITTRTTLRIGRKLKVSGSVSSAATQIDPNATYHTIVSGDTLSGIAKRYRTTVSKLCALNNISSRTTLDLGRKLKVK